MKNDLNCNVSPPGGGLASPRPVEAIGRDSDFPVARESYTGFIYIHRYLRNQPVYQNSNRWHVFCELVLTAAYCDTGRNVNGKYVPVKRGQVVVGRRNTAARLGMKESTFRNQIAWLEREGYISRKRVDNAYSLVTVTEYGTYNYMPERGGQRVDNGVDNGKPPSKALNRKGLAAFDKALQDNGVDNKGSRLGERKEY